MKKVVLLGFSALSVLGLSACTDDKETDVEVSQEIVMESEEVTSIGFVTYIKENEYVVIEVEGVTLQFETETDGISIGNRVTVTYEGDLEDQKISNIEIDKEINDNPNPTTPDSEKNTDKKVIYIDKYGNVIKDLEEFRENIKNNNLNSEEEEVVKEEVVKEEVKEPTTNKPVVEEVDKNKQEVTTTKIVFYGKADSHSVEVMHNGEVKVFYLEDDSISSKFDSMALEKEVTVGIYKDANGRTIIKTVK